MSRSRSARFVASSVAAVSLLAALACLDEGAAPIDLEDKLPAPTAQRDERPALRIAVGAMTSPEATFSAYLDLKNYMEQRLNKRVSLELRRSYREVNLMIENREVDVGFICSGAYVDLSERVPVDILAVPLIMGKDTYRSYIIARKDAAARSFAQLRGLHFAFTDPLSNSGYYYPQSRLLDLGQTDETFFSRVTFTHSHDNYISAVTLGQVDAAAVDQLVYDFLAERRPETVRDLRVIEESPPFGIPPVVSLASLDPKLKRQVRSLLLDLNAWPAGRQVLDSLRVDAFVAADPAKYQGLREVIKNVRTQQVQRK